MGAFGAITTLRDVGRSLHAWVVPEQAVIPQAWKEFTEDGRMKDPKLEERVKEVGRQVARFATLHACHRDHDFLKQWEKAPDNPGGNLSAPAR